MRMMRALTLALAGITLSAHAADEPAEYREDAYRSPVPETLEGVTVVDDDAAYAVWKTGAVVFIDVLPRPPKPKLPKGTIFREKPRMSIPGALWLPNVGYGRIAAVTDTYFRDHLAKAVKGDKDTPVLFFCLDDCWMSWNAAKRAREEYGYTTVFWYPHGTDGWAFEEYPLERVERAQ